MNVTKDGFKDRQLHIEDYLQMVSAEQKEHAGGVDGMSVDELLGFLKDNQKQLIQKIRDGKYKPSPVRRVEIPKETKGEFRKQGVPTVVDRVFQQAITQVLVPIYEKQFSENSFGFRPDKCQRWVRIRGRYGFGEIL